MENSKKLPIFHQNKIIASNIHRAITSTQMREKHLTAQSSQSSSVSSLICSLDSPEPNVRIDTPVNHLQLDAKNKNIKHKKRLTSLKKQQAYSNKVKPVNHKYLIDCLNANHDPYIASQLAAFKKAVANCKRPKFLHRMTRDSDYRSFLKQFSSDQSSKNIFALVGQYSDEIKD